MEKVASSMLAWHRMHGLDAMPASPCNGEGGQRQAQVVVVALGRGFVLAGGPGQADRFAASPFGRVKRWRTWITA